MTSSMAFDIVASKRKGLKVAPLFPGASPSIGLCRCPAKFGGRFPTVKPAGAASQEPLYIYKLQGHKVNDDGDSECIHKYRRLNTLETVASSLPSCRLKVSCNKQPTKPEPIFLPIDIE